MRLLLEKTLQIIIFLIFQANDDWVPKSFTSWGFVEQQVFLQSTARVKFFLTQFARAEVNWGENNFNTKCPRLLAVNAVKAKNF